MERFKKLATEFKGFVFGFVLSLFFVGGAVYAWNAVWHGTDWIGSGETIRAREIAENLEWLKREINSIKATGTHPANNATSTNLTSILATGFPNAVAPFPEIEKFPDILICKDYRHGGGLAVYYLLGYWKDYVVQGRDAVFYGLVAHNRDTYYAFTADGAFLYNIYNSDCSGKSIQQLINEGRGFDLNIRQRN